MEIDNAQDLEKTRRVAQANRKRLYLFSRRPQPPRGPQFTADGYVSWDEPQELRNVTHYNVYAGDDSTLYDRVPVGTTSLNTLPPDQRLVWVAAFNEESGLESPKVVAPAPTAVPNAPVVTPDDGNIVVNGDFSRFSTGWDFVGVVPPYATTGGRRDGGTCIIILGDTGDTSDRYATSTYRNAFRCAPGDTFSFTCWLVAIGSPNAATVCGINWLRADHSFIGSSADTYAAADYSSGPWIQTPVKHYTAPAGAVFLQAFVLSHTPNWGQNNKLTTGAWACDDVSIVRAAKMQTSTTSHSLAGGFDDQPVGTVTSWVQSSTAFAVVNDPSGAHSGSQYARGSATLAGGTMYFEQACPPDTRVNFSTWLKRVSGTGQSAVWVLFYGAAWDLRGSDSNSCASPAWQQMTCNAIAPAGTVHMRVGVQPLDTTSVWAVDDPSVTFTTVSTGLATSPPGNVQLTNNNTGASILPDWDFQRLPAGRLQPSSTTWMGACDDVREVAVIDSGNGSGYAGDKFVRLSGGSAMLQSPLINVQAGQVLNYAVWVRPAGIVPTGGYDNQLNLQLNWIYPAPTAGTTVADACTGVTPVWSMGMAKTVVVPAGAVQLIFKLFLNANESSAPNNACWWDIGVVLVQPVINQSSNGTLGSAAYGTSGAYPATWSAASASSNSKLGDTSLVIQTSDGLRSAHHVCLPVANFKPFFLCDERVPRLGFPDDVYEGYLDSRSLSVGGGVAGVTKGFSVSILTPSATRITIDGAVGIDGSLRDGNGVYHTVKGGLIVS